MGKSFDNFEHEDNLNIKFIINSWLLNIPTVALYFNALTDIFKKTEIGNLSEHLNKNFPLKLKASTAKICMVSK